MRDRFKRLARRVRTIAEQRHPEVSLVVPTYNVARYIGEFLESIFNQSAFPRGLEVIIVDDGSTDDVRIIVDTWIRRYPRVVRYIHQENSGLSSARNTGLAKARGKWVGFPDPDDFLDQDYFKHMLSAVRGTPRLAVAFSPFIVFSESSGEYRETHPLHYRFETPQLLRTLPDLGDWVLASVASAWIRRRLVRRNRARFDLRVKPGSEDGKFLNSLLASSRGWLVAAVPKALYFYRKRADSSSLLDGGKNQREWFLDELRYGVVELLQTLAARSRPIPVFVQRWALYILMWRFRWVVNRRDRLEPLSTDEVAEFVSLVHRGISLVDASTIQRFHLAGASERYKVGLLWRYKGIRNTPTRIYLRDVDPRQGLVQFSFFRGADDHYFPEIRINGEVQEARLRSRTSASFVDDTLWVEEFFWVPMEPGDVIELEVDGTPCSIRRNAQRLGERASRTELEDALLPKDEGARVRRRILAAASRFSGCLVLMDSGDRADDNAEHLYRHLMRSGRAETAYYVLARESADWGRLHREGFQLLEWGSDEHLAAQMSAAVLASSHADRHILWPVPKGQVEELAGFQFVFLQHGVTKDDISYWLNAKPIRLFITSTPAEAQSIAAERSPYRFTNREVVLTGMPRHDSLLSESERVAANTIVLMPTWRKHLTSEGDEHGIQRRGRIADFESTSWAINWSQLLGSEAVRDLARDHGLRIAWAPHPNMEVYDSDIYVPEWVDKVNVRSTDYQGLLASAALAVTDYSSAAFDVAYLDRPIVYFQFDRDQLDTMGHVWRPGYFSYANDGFGPVCDTVDEVVASVATALAGQEDPMYSHRRLETFLFKDGRCSERVAKEIARLLDG